MWEIKLKTDTEIKTKLTSPIFSQTIKENKKLIHEEMCKIVGWVHIGMVRSDLAPLLYDLLARLAR